MLQYCSVCKAQFDMSVVSESAEDGVIWLKCPNCQGILPHMPETDSGGVADEKVGEQEGAAAVQAEEAVPEIDPSLAKVYLPQETYEVGDVLHHRGWNDYGVVTEKLELPGNRHVIKVRFVENGELQLIEGTGG